jgi:hypothetical protein
MNTSDAVGSQTSRKATVLILGLVSLFVLVPLLVFGIPGSRDLTHHSHLALAFFDSISAGKIIPGWLADANNGYGDVSVRFYPPGLSLLLATFRVLLRSWYLSFVVVLTLLTFIGGLGAYYWAKEFVPSRYAVWAGALFIVSPYHINELFQSSLVAEYAAVSVLPFAFAFTERICRGGRRSDIAGLGAAYALLLLFNLPMAVIGSYALAFYLFLRLDWSAPLANVVRFGSGIGLGLVCSAFYWVKVVSELPWLRPESEGTFSATNFVFSSLAKRERDTGIWYANLLELATIALLLPALVLLARRHRNDHGSLIWGAGCITLISLLMTTQLSQPIWAILPGIKNVQVPWRWLAVSSIGASVLVAASIPAWWKIATGKGRPIALLAAGCILLQLAFTVAHPIREAQYVWPEEINNIPSYMPGTRSIGPWFPTWTGTWVPDMPTELVVDGRNVVQTGSAPEHRQYTVGAGTPAEGRVRMLYYPLWEATANGKPLNTSPAPDGVLLIPVPPEEVNVSLDFREPRRTLYSGILSILGLIVLLMFGLTRRKAIGGFGTVPQG